MGPIIDPSSTPPTRRVRRESAPRSTCAGKKAALSASSQGRQGGRAQVHRSSTHSSFSTMSPTSATRSLAIHPETTTHSQLSPEDQLFTGVSESYVRLSIGIEHIDDVLADESRCRETREETLGSANLSTKRQRIAELARTTAGTSSPPCASRQASHGRRPLRQRERNSSVKNRMRESCTSGCVSSEGWHVQQEKGLPGQESEAP